MGHPDNLLTNDPETFPLLQPGHSPGPSTYCCVGTDGSLWGRCLTTGRYLDYSQDWRHLSLVRAGPPNQKVEPPASPGPACPLRPPQLPSGSHQLCFGQEYAVSVGAGKTAAGAGSCRQAWLGPSREGSLMRTQHGRPAPIRWC